MLRALELRNFRGFDSHTLPFRDQSIIVGKNNAGKSTIVEALRLVAIVSSRNQNLVYKEPPSWTNLPRRSWGVSPSLRGLDINFQSLFHRYAAPPARVIAHFGDGARIDLYIQDEDKVFGLIYDPSGNLITSKARAAQHALPTVSILPQISPVQREEVLLNGEYVKRSLSSSLFSSHFRNQVKIFKEVYDDFSRIVEETWPGVQIVELICESNLPGRPIYLEIRNDDFVAELAAMGHGLQMWVQTMWFLTHSRMSDTVILDEPDVYMHPDLQRKIIRMLRDRFPQVIVATHSVEMLSEVEPEDILIVDRKHRKSLYADSLPAVQRIANEIGSAHNLHLARMWRAKKLIMVEGKDLKLLKHFQNVLIPNSESPFDVIPNMSIGGWGGWSYAIGSSLALKNSLGEKLAAYCVLDSDYHTEDEITNRLFEASEKGVKLHIWSRKEIENYVLCATAIARVIGDRASKRTTTPEPEEVADKIKEIAVQFRETVFDGFAANFLAGNRALGSGGANKKAREALAKVESMEGGLLNCVSGKAVLSELSGWSQAEFGVAFGSAMIAKAMTVDEIPAELSSVVFGLENGTDI